MSRLFRRLSMPRLLSGTLTASAVLALGFAGCSSETTGAEDDVCMSDEQYFAEKVYFAWMKDNCGSCHQDGSVGAVQSDFDLRPTSQGGFLEDNLNMVRKIAATQRNGKSVLLDKATGGDSHGGGRVLEPGSQEYQQLESLVQRFDEPDECSTTQASYLAGVELMSAPETLRKAALVLGARLPTQEEQDKVAQGGFEALGPILDQILSEEAFYDRVKEVYNDKLYTDFYLNGEGVNLLQDENYSPDWHEQEFGENGEAITSDDIKKYGAQSRDDLMNKLGRWSNEAVAREPLELIAYVIRNNRPFTEVITANYILVNPFSAKVYNVFDDVQFDNDANKYEWREARIGYGTEYGLPHAGVLTSPMFLARHPTTDTNVNRHRAKEVLDVWLATDMLKAAERPIDATQVDRKFNPTMNDPNCSVCHEAIDPVAGAFQNYQSDDQILFNPEFEWFQDMRPPGFNGNEMPYAEYKNALQWLGRQMANDARFSVAATQMAFRIAVGQDPAVPPADPTSPTFKGDLDAYLGQYYELSKVSHRFAEKNNYQFKALVKDIVMGPYFRAKNAARNIQPGQLARFGEIGRSHLLTPEQFDRKIRNVLGSHWWFDDEEGDRSFLRNDYRMLFGGIDSMDTTVRIKSPNGIMANVIERFGHEMGCKLVRAEFSIPQTDRRLLSFVEPTVLPEDVNGYEIPAASSSIKQNIVHLYERLLGERYAENDPEVQRAYQLFIETWREGREALTKETPGYVSWMPCGMPERNGRAFNYVTGRDIEIPEGEGAESPIFDGDPDYTGRAWAAVLAFIITDFDFVYE